MNLQPLKIEKYIKLELLNWQEEVLEEVQGRVTSGGTLSIDGNSATRQSTSFSFLLGNVNSITKIENLIGLNKKFRLFIGINDVNDNIVWFGKGIFVFNQASISKNLTNEITMNVSARDKMCLLDGTLAGKLPDPIVFHEIEDPPVEGSTNITYSSPTIYEILYYLIRDYGGEPGSNIIINDIPQEARLLMEYRGAEFLWLNDDGNIKYGEEEPVPNGTYKSYSAGECIGYTITPFTYPGELICSAGETICSILDKIKAVLGGNFEYFYDTEGRFVFQEIKNYINTVFAPSEIYNLTDDSYNIDTSRQEIVYSFIGSEIVADYSRNPTYENIKNDFIVWGSRKLASGGSVPIHYHLAVDDIPSNIIGNEDWRNVIYRQGPTGEYGYYHKEFNTPYLQSNGETLKEWELMYDTSNNEWKPLVTKTPEKLNYFIDFLDSSGVFGEYSVRQIGRRTEVLVDEDIGYIYAKEVPDILYVLTPEEKTQYQILGYNKVFVVNQGFMDMMRLSSRGRSAYEAVRELMYENLILKETVNFNAIPVYSLEVNTKVLVEDEDTGIQGEYLIKSISFPLDYNGMMSITANKIFKRI